MKGLALNSYGIYVWTCFAITLGVVVFSDWRARARHKKVYRDIEVRIKALEERE